VRALEVESWHVQVREGETVFAIPRDEIQAIRIVADPQSS
jgi:hypothetical protein